MRRVNRLNLLVLLLFLLLFLPNTFAALSCSVIDTNTNTCQGAIIFKMSALTNAHAEISSSGNYHYGVCCQAPGPTLTNLCTNNPAQVIKLSDITNAHVERADYTPSTYPNTVCISARESAPTLLCTATTQSCIAIGYNTCLASISGDPLTGGTNAHVADCLTDPYPWKICCKTSSLPCTATAEPGTITGAIRDQDNKAIPDVDVSAQQGQSSIKTVLTGQNGIYSMSIGCGNYNLVASRTGYISQAKSNINVGPTETTVVDFSLILGTTCKSDCTYVFDNTIHASCDGRNGCTFYDAIAKAACDYSQPGWFRDYDTNNFVICAGGPLQLKTEIVASVSCESGTLVKMTRIAVYNGKPVKIVAATCR